MQIVDLLATFSDPEAIESLSASQRLTAGLITTLLGMGITFLALVVLMLVTSVLDKLVGAEKVPAGAPRAIGSAPIGSAVDDLESSRREQGDDELVAAITAALAVMLETSEARFVVRKITRVEDSSTVWSRAGIAEQLQNRT